MTLSRYSLVVACVGIIVRPAAAAASPPNDDMARATPLPSKTVVDVAFDGTGATVDRSEADVPPGPGTLWWTWKAPRAGWYAVDDCEQFNRQEKGSFWASPSVFTREPDGSLRRLTDEVMAAWSEMPAFWTPKGRTHWIRMTTLEAPGRVRLFRVATRRLGVPIHIDLGSKLPAAVDQPIFGDAEDAKPGDHTVEQPMELEIRPATARSRAVPIPREVATQRWIWTPPREGFYRVIDLRERDLLSPPVKVNGDERYPAKGVPSTAWHVEARCLLPSDRIQFRIEEWPQDANDSPAKSATLTDADFDREITGSNPAVRGNPGDVPGLSPPTLSFLWWRWTPREPTWVTLHERGEFAGVTLFSGAPADTAAEVLNEAVLATPDAPLLVRGTGEAPRFRLQKLKEPPVTGNTARATAAEVTFSGRRVSFRGVLRPEAPERWWKAICPVEGVVPRCSSAAPELWVNGEPFEAERHARVRPGDQLLFHCALGSSQGWQEMDETVEIFPTTPTNDNFADAGAVVPVSPTQFELRAVGVRATSEPGEPPPPPVAYGPASLWWKWTAPEAMGVETHAEVFRGESLDSLKRIDPQPWGQGRAFCPVRAGETVHFRMLCEEDALWVKQSVTLKRDR